MNEQVNAIISESISYGKLVDIIREYYKEVYSMDIWLDGSYTGDYLKESIKNNEKIFSISTGKGMFDRAKFNVPKEDIEKIVKSYLSSKNYELLSLELDNSVNLTYNVKQQSPKTNESKEDPQAELARMERENRKFTILQRERAMTEENKAKNKAGIMAGLCILGAGVAAYFNQQDVHQVIQNELNSIYSWKALGQYIQDLGPLTTMLAAGAGAFIAKYFKHSKKYKQAQNEFVDFNASLENTQTLGGNENAKTR